MLDTEKLLHYLKNEFPDCLNTHFNYDLIINLCDVLFELLGNTSDTVHILADIIPEVTFEEINQFFNE